MVSFIFIAFLVVKLKKLKCFRGNVASMKLTHFRGGLGRNSPKCGPILLKFVPQLLLKESKTLFLEFSKNLKIRIFIRIWRTQSLQFFSVFVQLWPRFSPWRRPKSKRLDYLHGQNYVIRLSKNRKIKALSCPNFLGKIKLLFVLFCPFFAEKTGVVTL